MCTFAQCWLWLSLCVGVTIRSMNDRSGYM